MPAIHRISPCLWFDDQAEQAAEFYTGIFRRSKIARTTRYGEAGREVHGKAEEEARHRRAAARVCRRMSPLWISPARAGDRLTREARAPAR